VTRWQRQLDPCVLADRGEYPRDGYGALLLAGATNTNPVLAVLGILLILAWKNAAYLGLDRYPLPAFGTPWSQPNLERHTFPTSRPAVAPIR
jgi:hypothetical protein